MPSFLSSYCSSPTLPTPSSNNKPISSNFVDVAWVIDDIGKSEAEQ